MTKKTEVLRLTKLEHTFITTIRSLGLDNFYTHLENICHNGSISDNETTFMNNILSSLEDKESITLSDYIKKGVLSEEEVKCLVEAYTGGRNIVITGDLNSYKQSFLKRLISFSSQEIKSPEHRVMIIEHPAVEVPFKLNHHKIKTVSKLVDGGDSNLLTIFKNPIDRIIHTSVTTKNSFFDLLAPVSFNKSVIFTTHLFEDINKFIDAEVESDSLANTLKEANFVEIHCEHADNEVGHTICIKNL